MYTFEFMVYIFFKLNMGGIQRNKRSKICIVTNRTDNERYCKTHV